MERKIGSSFLKIKEKSAYLVIWTLSRQKACTDMTRFLSTVSTNNCACIKAQAE
jgi:hypothetical protein